MLNRPVEYADLDSASVVVLAGLEPEDEAGTLFLRLRKAATKGKTRVVTVAPYASRGTTKMNATLIATAPGAEAGALTELANNGEVALDAGGVILVGERLAQSPGALSAAADLAKTTGARLAWVPRRAGDRGAIEAGCLPTLLPGGRPVPPTRPHGWTWPLPGVSSTCPKPPVAMPIRSWLPSMPATWVDS